MCVSYADTELVGDDALEEVEEALEMEEDDGMKLEPFNLAQERQEGFFDEEGHYVEKIDKDEVEAEKDAWFASTKGDALHPCRKQSSHQRIITESGIAFSATLVMALWWDTRWRRGKMMRRRRWKKLLALPVQKVMALTRMAAVLLLMHGRQRLLGVALHDGSPFRLC